MKTALNLSRRATAALTLAALGALHAGGAAAQALDAAALSEVEPRIRAVAPKMVAWRRDIHQHPELSGQEVRTAKLVADHLRALGIEVRPNVGGHGVVGLLRGARPGKTVALRADMDALPMAEATGLPFASKARQMNMGQDSPVMHSCGHDGHTAILMGAAEVLAGMRPQLAGNVKFIFQPAEEGVSEPPKAGAAWGAKAMVEQGAMEGVDVIYGLHIIPMIPTGVLAYRTGPLLSAGDTVNIQVQGKQTHGAMPWNGIDPVVASAQIVLGLQTIVSRQLNISTEPAVLTIGAINGGVRENVVPEKVSMLGTLRTFDETMRADAKKRITTTAQSIASASGAKAEVSFGPSAYPVTSNPTALMEAALPALRLAAGDPAKVVVSPKVPASEDFSEFQAKVPGVFYLLGGMPAGKKASEVAPNHNPGFDFNEDAMPIGARSLVALTLDYLGRNRAP